MPPHASDLLLMAAYFHGQPDPGPSRANCWRVVRQAMRWAGDLDDAVDRTGGQEDHPVVDRWYRILIDLIRGPFATGALIWGAGNLGDADGNPPAHPAFTGCGLTEAGRRAAGELIAAHPHCRPGDEAR